MAATKTQQKSEETPICFAVMPISDVDGYEPGHFSHVYNDIIKVACERAGYLPKRADDTKATNLIHFDILTKLIDAPMAVCDLSTRNPNVMFELGLRQAFDRPTVLIRESGTKNIFDVDPFRYVEYSSGMKYTDVLKAQANVEEAIKATAAEAKAGTGINSIIKLLSLKKATLPEVDAENKEALSLNFVMSQVLELNKKFDYVLGRKSPSRESILTDEEERLSAELARQFRAICRDDKSSVEMKSQLSELRDRIRAIVKSKIVSEKARWQIAEPYGEVQAIIEHGMGDEHFLNK